MIMGFLYWAPNWVFILFTVFFITLLLLKFQSMSSHKARRFMIKRCSKEQMYGWNFLGTLGRLAVRSHHWFQRAGSATKSMEFKGSKQSLDHAWFPYLSWQSTCIDVAGCQKWAINLVCVGMPVRLVGKPAPSRRFQCQKQGASEQVSQRRKWNKMGEGSDGCNWVGEGAVGWRNGWSS